MPADVQHAPDCPGEDVEVYGRTDPSGARALIVDCRSCRASSAAPWPLGAPPPRPRPRPAAGPVCPACAAPVPDDDDLCPGCRTPADTGEEL